MKKITQKEIEKVKAELAANRKEFDKINFSSLDEKLNWIRNFFNSYIPELEKRYMKKGDFEKGKFLPDKIRIYFYLYFPEHGLNMDHFAEKCARRLKCRRNRKEVYNIVKLKSMEEIEKVKVELAAKRVEFDRINFRSLDKKLKWIRNFFNSYIPELKKRYMNEGDFEKFQILPDKIKIYFYLYFPEHGLNMVHFAEKCARKLNRKRVYEKITQEDIEKLIKPKSMEEIESKIFLRHQD